MGSTASRKMATDGKPRSENIYELRGVLLHKGASAYHGHYEAQVFDVMYVFLPLDLIISYQLDVTQEQSLVSIRR